MKNFKLKLSAVVMTAFVIQLIVNHQVLSQSVNNSELKLVYNYPSGSPVKYLSLTKIDQNMNVNGDIMQVKVTSATGCSIRSVGKAGNDLKLIIRIDTMGQYMNSPQGSMGGAFSGVAGREFEMTISADGKEKDLSGAGAVKYYVEGSGQADAAGSFIDFFPDLPAGAVTAGYKWSSPDTVEFGTESSKQRMVVNSDYAIEGVEVKDGKAIVLIKGTLSGIYEMKTVSQGMNVNIGGSLEGTTEYLFSVSDGYFLKQKTSSTVVGTIIVNMGDVMEFPVEMKIESVNEMLR